jgi:hypothetical protein
LDPRIRFAAFFTILSFTFLLSSGYAYQTTKLFVVSIDGIRDHEAFAYVFEPGDSIHPYMPFIWNTLKPQGTAYMEMYNEAVTFTSPAHQTILTGNWNFMPNHYRDEFVHQTRPWSPTIFEYARSGLSLPKSETWCVVGKKNCMESNWSLHPAYGEDYGARMAQYPPDEVPETDSLTVDALMQILDANHPSLVFVNLQGVDMIAHTGIYEDYLDAIRLADRSVQRIWDRINADSIYIGNTTLILTTDHGRHDDGLGGEVRPGFQSHGGICHGCRHLMFLAVGPDTPDSLEITRRAYQIDIAPTIGELLGFDTPFTRGQVLRELISGYNDPDRLIRKDPTVDRRDENVFVAWSDNQSGNEEIYFIASVDSGRTFGDTIPMSSSGVCAIQPDLAVQDSVVHLIWLDYKAENWEIFYRRSHDSGLTWEDERLLHSSVEEDSLLEDAILLWEPKLDVDGERCLISVSGHPHYISTILSEDGGDTWLIDDITNTSNYPTDAVGAVIGNRMGVAWSVQTWSPGPFRSWDIHFIRGDYPGQNWNVYRRLSDDSPYSIQPSIASDGYRGVGVAWADNEFDVFQILFRGSRNEGIVWYPKEVVTSNPKGAWQPVLSWDNLLRSLHMIWTNFLDEGSEVYHARTITANWSTPEQLTETEGWVNRPDMVIDSNGNSYFVWEIVTNEEISIGMGDLLGP